MDVYTAEAEIFHARVGEKSAKTGWGIYIYIYICIIYAVISRVGATGWDEEWSVDLI